ncbi:helix-hairpin-helix domain-containing protein [Acetobacterium wieringae]|uniref:Competence protein n=1 Tax=Acetobacterium wieringae TaxID=52694 RepID=A0A5D0WH46_9FIRM|nr:helix-hairpin-helix domain-containing protein [Acetobacterium wieringae]HAZ05597.1 competence protein [Acetobacterium sp.]MEA4805352.1 helix-hairpin-helix domain-containing protein [Acetobacterium wieringae]TYC82240.1 competence protein [Acetobacterium wieringae]UYO61753.1 helix-hairpin-helix domain-containing protein [Acetobacterium wieringae]VUZ28143.1 ComE operon protein 1 [Acetobacterium wieringae]
MDKLDRNKILYILIVLVFLGVFWGWYHFKESSDTAISISDATALENGADENNQSDQGQMMVHITGAVKQPGVVSLKPEARLIEAIELVGGLTETADVDSLNLARKIQDEEKIHIPAMGEVSATAVSSENDKVNINTASLEELKSLPGVGDVIAQGIIDYREKNGGFKQLEELKNVTRIGDKVYDGLSESIVI